MKQTMIIAATLKQSIKSMPPPFSQLSSSSSSLSSSTHPSSSSPSSLSSSSSLSWSLSPLLASCFCLPSFCSPPHSRQSPPQLLPPPVPRRHRPLPLLPAGLYLASPPSLSSSALIVTCTVYESQRLRQPLDLDAVVTYPVRRRRDPCLLEQSVYQMLSRRCSAVVPDYSRSPAIGPGDCQSHPF